MLMQQSALLGRRVACAAVLAALSATTAQAAANPNDGRWSVEVITEKGDCDRAYRYALVVENGVARYGGTESVSVTGKVAGNGAVRGAIAYGESRADVVGKLSGGTGSGSWTFRGGRSCSGSWNAERRG